MKQEIKDMAVALELMIMIFIMNLCATNATQSTAHNNTSWQNNQGSAQESYNFVDGSHVRTLLVRNGASKSYPKFGFGFLRNGTTDEIFYLVTVRFVGEITSSSNHQNHPPVILWFANGQSPVKENATLEFTADGDLILKDADGTRVWSTETSGSNVTRITLDGNGNLRLYDAKNRPHWISFLHPTNTWLPGQRLHVHKMMASTNSTTSLSQGKFILSLSPKGIEVFLNMSTVKRFQTIPYRNYLLNMSSAVLNKSAILVFNKSGSHITYEVAPRSKFHYMRLEPNGHLNIYQLDNGYSDNADLSRDEHYGDCIYPTKCGNYGVCSNGECTCPGSSSYFKQSNDSGNGFSCAEVTHLSCQLKHLQRFLKLENVTYFDFVPHLINIDAEGCQRACLGNCSCKAALFRYQGSLSTGNCSLPTEIYTLRNSTKVISGYNDITFIKVQLPSDQNKLSLLFMLLLSVSAFLLLVIGASIYLYKRWREGKRRDKSTDESSVHVANHLVKFSSKAMKYATRDFQIRLGRGGSGSVFEGLLNDGTKVAVKRLNPGENRGKKEFLSEVETIGNIHHFNLVRLVGYCAERSNRFLVYEYMCNGSLDKWIYHKDRMQTLSWDIRKKIIFQISRGLEYLHDYCNPKIIHFDIKPQNILLDRDLNVKIADFGLARLIAQDQSHVSTMPKGTPGYMAPELTRGNSITAKIDIYSFGVVILEIICGRRSSDPKGGDYLVDTLKVKAEADRLCDLVDEKSEDMQSHRDEAVKMIQIAISCLQKNLHRRPSASMLVTVLQGLTKLEPVTDYGFLSFAVEEETPQEVVPIRSSPITAATLSGPR